MLGIVLTPCAEHLISKWNQLDRFKRSSYLRPHIPEIDQIERFPTADKLCAYAGLVPTTKSSGGKVHHGRLLSSCNKWLRWALIEASWVAIGGSPYFGALYRHQRARGKKVNTSITIVARRMCRILFQLLTEKRNFEKRAPEVQTHFVPGCSAHKLTAVSVMRP